MFQKIRTYDLEYYNYIMTLPWQAIRVKQELLNYCLEDTIGRG